MLLAFETVPLSSVQFKMVSRPSGKPIFIFINPVCLRSFPNVAFETVPISSVQFKMVSRRSEKPIYAKVSEAFPMLPLKEFQ